MTPQELKNHFSVENRDEQLARQFDLFQHLFELSGMSAFDTPGERQAYAWAWTDCWRFLTGNADEGEAIV